MNPKSAAGRVASQRAVESSKGLFAQLQPTKPAVHGGCRVEVLKSGRRRVGFAGRGRAVAALCLLLAMTSRGVAALPAVGVLWQLPEGNAVGLPVTFAAVITNSGPGAITQIYFTSSIPPQLTNITVTVSQGTFAVSNAAVRSDLGSLADGASATVSFTGQPASPGFATMDYEFTGRSEDDTFLNHYGQVSVRFGVADLAVNLVLLTNVFPAGVPYEAAIVITNLGPDRAGEVLLSFLPSDGQEIMSLRSPVGTHPPANGGWQVINLGPLSAHEAVVVEATLLPVRVGALHLIAQTQQPEFDPDDQNHHALVEFSGQAGAGVIQFGLGEQVVSERAGQVIIPIHRREGAEATVAVAYLVQDLTALAGIHHAGTNGLLTFAVGETNKTLIIPILQDSRSECSREFRILLQDASGGALVRNITNLTATILDDDVLATGALEAVSVSSNRLDSGNNGSAYAALTPDGRWAAFASYANNLVANTNGRRPQIYLRDLVQGITHHIAPSPSSNAVPATEAYASFPALSADGRYVVFIGGGDGWVTNTLPPGAEQVFQHDTITHTTQLITITPSGGGSDGRCPSRPDGFCFYAGMSADGQRILFFNDSALMTPLNSNRVEQLYLRDVATRRTVTVSSNYFSNGLGNGPVWEASLSADGNVIAFASTAANLVPGFSYVAGFPFPDTQIYLRDLRSNVTTVVTLSTNGGFAPGPSGSPRVTPDGRFVIFRSWNNALVPDDDHVGPDIFRYEVATRKLRRVTPATPGENISPSVSADGRFIAYRNGTQSPRDSAQVFLFDCASNSTTLVSVNCHATGPGNRHSLNPVISANGDYVYFQSCALDLAPGEISADHFSVYRRDRARQTTELVSLNRELTGSAEGNTGTVSISADGHLALLSSDADNLVWGDNNFTLDLFAWRAGQTREPGPRLVIERAPQELILRWPAGLTGFMLQTSPSLSTPAWTDLSPTDAATEWRETPEQPAFYRLRR